FVSVDGLEIVGVTADRVLQCDTVRAKDGTGFTGSFESFTHVVALGNRDLHRVQQPFILEASKLKGKQLSFDQLGCHDGKLLLHELEAGNGTIKLDAGFSVVESSFVEIGRASCRERVESWVVGGVVKK